jgi:hypothetical protein
LRRLQFENLNHRETEMALRPCKECGRQISSDNKFCPHCGKKVGASRLEKGFLVAFFAFLVVGYISNAAHQSGVTGSPAPPSNSPSLNAPPPLKLPASQASFVSIVSVAQSQSQNVANDMQRGGVKASRDQSLCAQLESLNVTDWVGTVKKIDSNSEGKGVLAVDVAPGISLETWNNGLSDIGSNTLIEPGSPVFQSASAMEQGQRVTFSGTFLPGNSHSGDCIKEASLSLRGKVESPDFIFRFSKISPYLAGQQEATLIRSNASTAPGDASTRPAAEQTSVLGFSLGESAEKMGARARDLGYRPIDCQQLGEGGKKYSECKFVRGNGDSLTAIFIKGKLKDLDFSFRIEDYDQVLQAIERDHGPGSFQGGYGQWGCHADGFIISLNKTPDMTRGTLSAMIFQID